MSMETKMATNVENVKIMISSLLGKGKVENAWIF